MTIRTAGRAGSTQRMTHTVYAGGVLFGGLIVASSAIDRLGREVVVRVFARDIRVAAGASVGAMHRRRKFRLIDKQPNRFAGRVGLVESFIGMAFEAGGVGILFGSECRTGPEEIRKNQQDNRGNPKAEGRRPKEGRNPRAEGRTKTESRKPKANDTEPMTVR